MAQAHSPELCGGQGKATAASAWQGRPAASPGPHSPLGPSPWPRRPTEAMLSGSGAVDHGLPAAAASVRPTGSAHPALQFQQFQSSAPEGPQEPPRAARSQGLTRKRDGSTNPTHGSAWACFCMGSAGLGHCTLIPRPLRTAPARAASPPRLTWAILPFPSSGARDPGRGPWIVPCLPRDSPEQEAAMSGTGDCACGQWPSASHLYVSQQLLLAAADVLQLLALLRGQVTGH